VRRRQHLTTTRTDHTIDRSTRTAALIATAVAVPVVLAVAFLVGETDGGSAAPTPTASSTPGPLRTTVPDLDQATAAICDPVMQAMPVTLDPGDGSAPLRPLVVTPGGPSFLAWGDPLVTLQCGVPRPAELRDDYDYQPQQIDGPDGAGALWIAKDDGDQVVWTVIDREVYLRAVVPKGQPGYIVDFSSIIGRLLPAVCTVPTPGDGPDAKYCGSRP
jgi:hypothetical protein